MAGQNSSFSKRVIFLILAYLLGSVMGIQNCAVWNEISPCTCQVETSKTSITCERMNSFGDIVNILKNRFSPKDRISLTIRGSDLYDLSQRSFKELNMNIEKLFLNFVNLR